MNTVKELIYANAWIRDITASRANSTALKMLAKVAIPKTYRKEMEATAKTYGVSYTQVLALNLSYELAILALMVEQVPSLPDIVKCLGWAARKAKPVGCTTIVVDDGATRFGRNLDWDDSSGYLKASTSTVTNTDSTSVTFEGMTGRLTARRFGKDGDDGYVVAINAVCVDDGAFSMGACPTLLLREVIDTCATYEEAVDKLSTTPLICPVVFTIAASEGRMLAIERSSMSYAHRGPELYEIDDTLIKAHPITSDNNGVMRILVTCNSMRKMGSDGNVSLGELSETSDARYDRVIDGFVLDNKSMPDLLKGAEFGCTVYSATCDLLGPQSPLYYAT